MSEATRGLPGCSRTASSARRTARCRRSRWRSDEPADTRRGHQQRHVPVVGTETLELPSDLGDLPVELIDRIRRRQARRVRHARRRDGARRGVRQVEPTSRWAHPPVSPLHRRGTESKLTWLVPSRCSDASEQDLLRRGPSGGDSGVCGQRGLGDLEGLESQSKELITDGLLAVLIYATPVYATPADSQTRPW